MIETLIALLAAHLVADFTLQPDALVRRKRKFIFLLGHILIVLAVAILALGAAPPRLLAILILTHIAMDAIKVYWLPDKLWSFLLDQGVHLFVIMGLAAAYPAVLETGWWPQILPINGAIYLAGLCLVGGLVASVQMGAVMIRKSVEGLALNVGDEDNGLPNGGYVIGCLERAFILLLVLIGQPGGVGFLVAAKSILRFGDVQNERGITEYIIIGTLLSFGWGLLVAALTLAGISYFLPGLGLSF